MILYRAARTLVTKGLSIFPCHPKAKTPATPNGLLAATTDPETIKQWWSANQDYNIGIASGETSGVWVIDIDGDTGEATLRALETEHGALPPTVEVVTGSGGRHLYFRLADEPIRNSAGKIGPGIDVRGDGGYVLAPPSMHPCGRCYQWSVDSAAEFAAAPHWLIARLADHAEGKGKPLEEWHRTLTSPIPNGQRNTTLASICGRLIFHGLDLIEVRDLLAAVNIARCDPPLPDDEINTVVCSVAKTHLRAGR
jgi:hypothetical protein